ncbi:serine/threonine-protein kinase [Streptomyces sp. DSM 40750]|uniref:serine/threonine-protein kinase n=1 Tax=Streptomyces sp. DSM 40750 TaxID=2801030 RepID=UPI00214B25C6|nr:serine/threonine-protein kinase [Streptomyces sp. DSM 40750]UUU24446.1 protein kinase [Streptomyces sp. DSM 40750]
MSDDGEHPHDAPPHDNRDPGHHARLVGGRYRLTERIGSGGMGTVWKAVDELVEREVAVKQPRLPGDPADPDGGPEDQHRQRAANRLYREARAAARVDHPSAVTIHDVVIEDGHPWIVMEWVRGESLHELLRRGALTPAESARIGLAVVGALHAAHSVGIVHRDVKPANVLLGPHGRVVLTDFGIAHVQGEEALTVSGEFVGSIEFVAPERMSDRTAGPPSDLWSLGVLLYAAVEGWSPFRRTTLESTLAAILSTEPPEPERAGPLGPLIVRLLAKEPAARPEADEVRAVLEAVAEGRPGPEPDVPARATAVRVAEGRAAEVGVAEGRAAEVRVVEGPVPAGLPEPRDDSRTVRLGTARGTARGSTARGSTGRGNTGRRGTGRLLLIATLTGALLAGGGVWLGTSLAREDTETVSDPVATGPTGPTGSVRWISHEEKAMDAVLSLPAAYERLRARDGKGDQPRTVTYEGEEVIRVRLTQWDEAPASPMEQAKDATDIVARDVKSAANYTTTSFHDQEAVLADTTHYQDGTPTRVMELIVRTDDGRMYELRVDMPKGTADEKKGTAVFKGARDRLEIGKQ